MKVLACMSGAANAGKTATAVTLGTKMALRGQRVLLIDLDRQRTASFYLDREIDPYESDQYYIGDVLVQRRKVKVEGQQDRRAVRLVDAIQPTAIENLFVVASHSNIMVDALEMARLNAVERLAVELRALDGYFDVVILDCPGELNIIATAAITASTDILLCISPTIKHIDVDDVWGFIDSMRENGKTRARISAVIPCIVNRRGEGAFYQEVMKAVTESPRFRDLMTPPVRKQHWEPQAYGRKTPLPLAFPSSPVNKDYDDVLRELDKREITNQQEAA